MNDDSVNRLIADYWASFYSRREVLPPEEPSPFAIWAERDMPPDCSVVEVGCGTGRDSLYFAHKGHRVVAIDQSLEAISLVKHHAQSLDMGRLQTVAASVSTLANSATTPDIREMVGRSTCSAYARFFLHAITDHEQTEFFGWLSQFLNQGEFCYLEYRAATLGDHDYAFGSHYRRPVTPDALAKHCKELGFEVTHSAESDLFAPYGDERPLVGRTVLRRG